MKRFYTTIEQSKKLLEVGIDPGTADMFWKNGVSDKYFQCFTPYVNSGTDIDYDYDIPCWSVGALLDLFPRDKESPILNVTRGWYNIKGSYTRDWFVTLDDENNNINYSEQAPELIDAVVNMVVQLKEKNLL